MHRRQRKTRRGSCRHHQVLVEIGHVDRVADRQMHANGGDQTEDREHERSLTRLIADQD